MNIVVGFVQKIPEERVFGWAESLRKVSDARAVVLCHPVEQYAKLSARYKVELIDCPDLWRDERDGQSICKDRWDVMAREFQNFPDDARVLVTDMTDLVFQRDPFPQLHPEKITVATEGVTFGENGWGMTLTDHHMKHARDLMAGSRMICAGVWAAPVPLAREFCRDVYAEAKSRPGGVDQHCMNLVLYRDYADRAYAVPYSEAWCAHLSLMYQGKPNTGPDNAGNRFEERPVLRNDVMVTERGDDPFAIVHHIWHGRWPGLRVLGGGRT